MLRVLGVGFDENEDHKIQSILGKDGLIFNFQQVTYQSIGEIGAGLDAYDLILMRDCDTQGLTVSTLMCIDKNESASPVFVLTRFQDEIRAISLVNSGAERVLSFDLLEETLPACIKALCGGGSTQTSPSIHEPATHYGLPDGLVKMQSRMQSVLGTPKFLELILNTFSSVVIVLDFDGSIIFFNHRAELISGYTFEEVKGRNIVDLLLLPEEEEEVIRIFHDLRSGIYPEQHQNSWLTRTGAIKRLEWSNTLLDDPESGQAYVIGMGLDITEDYEKSQALYESEERFSKVFHANPEGMAIMDYRDGRITDINARFLTLINQSREMVLGRTIYEVGLLNRLDDWETNILAKIQETPLFSIKRKVILTGDQLIFVMLTFDVVEINNRTSILMTAQDQTNQMLDDEQARRFHLELEGSILEHSAALEAVNRELKSEIAFRKALESSSQRLIQIIWETPDIVAISAHGGRVQYLNKAGRQMLGINETDPVSHLSVYSVYTDEFNQYVRTHIAPLIQEQGVWHGETEFHLPDGRVIPVSQVIIGHRDQNGEIQFYSSVARDITDLRQASEDLRLAYEKEKELGRLRASFFSMTSHQFRTPLSTILSSAELLEHYGDQWTVEKRRMHTQRIQDATMRLSQMLNDILEYSKIEARQGNILIEGINLEELCLKIMHDLNMADQEQHNFRINCGSKPCCVYSDRLSLELIVENLIANAIKYSSKGSNITVRIDFTDGMVSLSVKDEGIGILPTEQELIFEPFHRGSNVVDTPGSGLGLMIVRKSLELIQGAISVKSGLGEGTEFTISIPDLRG